MKWEQAGKWVLSILLWFWVGGVYFFGEVIWKTSQGRPETISWTMFVLAIVLAIPLERCGAELPWEMPLLGQACICTAVITATEFVAGLILNVWLGLGVWDYSNMPFNLLGQICLPFTLAWVALSAIAIVLDDYLRHLMFHEEKPHYKIF